MDLDPNPDTTQIQSLFQFQLFSDIHLELRSNENFRPVPKAQNLILAGDIGNISKPNYKQFFDYCSTHWTKIYYVAGNHEFHHKRTMGTVNTSMSDLLSNYSNITFLNNTWEFNEGFVIYGFVGWTYPIFRDYYEASTHLNDYKRINTTSGKFSTSFHNELAHDGLQRFKSFIETANQDPNIKNIIVVTHFPPINTLENPTSNPVYGVDDPLKNYYTWSNMLETEKIDGEKIRLWCSGHTHWKYDFTHETIRYISNPVGYADEEFELNEEPYDMYFNETIDVQINI